MREERIVAVCGAIVARGDEILVIQEARPGVRGKYNIPGGHIEPGEDLKTTVIREVKEETGISIMLEGFLGIYPHQISDKSTVLKLVFTAKPTDFNFRLSSEEVLNVSWMSINFFKKIEETRLRSNDLPAMIDDYKNGLIFDSNVVKDMSQASSL